MSSLSDLRFDPHLAQASNIRSLFISLHDQVFQVREISLKLIARLAPRNPAYVLPSLRKSLLNFLRDLELGTDIIMQEQVKKKKIYPPKKIFFKFFFSISKNFFLFKKKI